MRPPNAERHRGFVAQVLDGTSVLAMSRQVAPILREEAAASEQRRQLTPRAVEALRSTGVFRMAMPAAWGGPEVDLCTQMEVLEELCRADGSAGWCAGVGSDGGYYSAALDDDVGRRLYRDLDAVTAGWIQPAGTLHVVDGGYRLSGRWSFGSGCSHADVIIGGATVCGDNGPVRTRDGRIVTKIAILPAERFTILDTWYSTGLAGSGSQDYCIDDAFVPAEHTFQFGDTRRDGALYAWPGLFTARFPGVPIGIARAALDSAEQLLAGKMLMPEEQPARDNPRVRTGMARVQAMVGSARSYAFDVVGEFWSTLQAGVEPSHRQRAALGGCHAHTTRTCRDAVQLLADTLGSESIYRSCPLERHLRDLITLSQHILAQRKSLEVAGGLWIDGANHDHPLVRQRLI
jgi:indole-3-acetate monooxygenase